MIGFETGTLRGSKTTSAPLVAEIVVFVFAVGFLLGARWGGGADDGVGDLRDLEWRLQLLETRETGSGDRRTEGSPDPESIRTGPRPKEGAAAPPRGGESELLLCGSHR